MRILVVEDDPPTVRMWRRLLRTMRHDVVIATSLPEAERLLATRPPGSLDVALLDLRLPGGSGLDLLPLLRRRFPCAGAAVVTAYLDAGVTLEAAARGALALPKPVSPQELERLLDLLAAPASARHAVVAVFPGLSDRQAEVVELAARGLDTKSIAQIMDVGERTVETYWRRIFARTGRHGRGEILAAVLAAAVHRPPS